MTSIKEMTPKEAQEKLAMTPVIDLLGLTQEEAKKQVESYTPEIGDASTLINKFKTYLLNTDKSTLLDLQQANLKFKGEMTTINLQLKVKKRKDEELQNLQRQELEKKLKKKREEEKQEEKKREEERRQNNAMMELEDIRHRQQKADEKKSEEILNEELAADNNYLELQRECSVSVRNESGLSLEKNISDRNLEIKKLGYQIDALEKTITVIKNLKKDIQNETREIGSFFDENHSKTNAFIQSKNERIISCYRVLQYKVDKTTNDRLKNRLETSFVEDRETVKLNDEPSSLKNLNTFIEETLYILGFDELTKKLNNQIAEISEKKNKSEADLTIFLQNSKTVIQSYKNPKPFKTVD